ncbi:fibro-slime domain-containing protein [Fibrobacter sp. UWB11]|nr:fibro-slime domain-containing protein [Fibrobacter sp. UWB11]
MNRNKRNMALIVPIMVFLAACAEDDPAPDGFVNGPQQKTTCPTDGAKPLAKEGANVDASSLSLDVVIRDFQQNHPDFENFSEEAVDHLDDIYNYETATGAAMKAFGFDEDWYAATSYHNTCGNMYTFEKFGAGIQIGVDGLPMQVNPFLPSYLQQVSTGPVLEYGECAETATAISGPRFLRGYKNALDNVNGTKCPGGKNNWANPVVYTPGMVDPYLLFTKLDNNESLNMYEGVVVQKLNERCDNRNFDQWFADVPTVNKRINMVLDLSKSSDENNDFVYNFNSNNGGFFPLDSVNPVNREWVMAKPCNPSIQPTGSCEIFEPQSLSIFCPPYKYQYAPTQQDLYGQSTAKLCADWLNAGGPRAVNSEGTGHSAALQAVTMNGALGLQHFRNYGFTMMGYMNFQYKASNQLPEPEVLKFISSGDLWVFVDGVLVVDLGGTHLPAPGSVNIQTLAQNNHGCHVGEPLAAYSSCKGASDVTGWADGSSHHLHFFVANRQTEISDFSMSLPSSFVASASEISYSGEAEKKGEESDGCAY